MPMSLQQLPAALIFDLDGTLVDTVAVRIAAWIRAFGEADIVTDRTHVAGLIGSDGRDLARDVARAAAVQLDTERAEELDQRAGAIYEELNVDPQPLPGVEATITALDELGLPWAIATSSRREQVVASIRALGLRTAPRIVDGSHVERAKPAPDLLLLAARELGVPPERCWYVGDATWDMRASVAAGMIGVAVAAGSAVEPAALREAGASVVLPTLTELADLLRRPASMSGGGSRRVTGRNSAR